MLEAKIYIHGKRSEVILFIFNMYLQQGGHRQKTTDNLMKIKQNKQTKKYIINADSHLFSNK